MTSISKLAASALLILSLAACSPSPSGEPPPTSGPTTNPNLVAPSSGTFQE